MNQVTRTSRRTDKVTSFSVNCDNVPHRIYTSGTWHMLDALIVGPDIRAPMTQFAAPSAVWHVHFGRETSTIATLRAAFATNVTSSFEVAHGPWPEMLELFLTYVALARRQA